MVRRLIDFVLVVIKLLMFKVWGRFSMSKSSFSIFPVLKGLIAFNYKEASLQRLDICSSNLNWLSIAIPLGCSNYFRRSTRWFFYNIYMMGIKNICHFCSISDNFSFAFYCNVFKPLFIKKGFTVFQNF